MAVGFAGIRLVAVDGEAPEDVVVDPAGRVYAGLADGRIVRVPAGGGAVVTVARTPGRPLGLELLETGELLVCASDAGLLVVSPDDGAVRTLTDRVAGRPLGACNNAAVADDGTVYFTDSSTRFPVPRWREDLVQRTRTGRLFRRDPDGTVTELLGGLEFANGVALAADGSYVAVAETATCRVRRPERGAGRRPARLSGQHLPRLRRPDLDRAAQPPDGGAHGGPAAARALGRWSAASPSGSSRSPPPASRCLPWTTTAGWCTTCPARCPGSSC